MAYVLIIIVGILLLSVGFKSHGIIEKICGWMLVILGSLNLLVILIKKNGHIKKMGKNGTFEG